MASAACENAEVCTNWSGDRSSKPASYVTAHCVDDIVDVVTNTEKYPSPVRAVGSRHSTTLCFEADGGTMINMREMNRILHVDTDVMTVTAEAGALYIDISHELQKHGLMHYINLEIGNITAGAAVLSQTKDSSFPGEFGQLSSYVSGVKMVTADGKLLSINEKDQPDMMYFVRNSYGLLGVVYEVTFRVKPLRLMQLEHKVYSFDEFLSKFSSLWQNKEQSVFAYMLPFREKVAVEFRKYVNDEEGREDSAAVGKARLEESNSWAYCFRNIAWKSIMPSIAHLSKRIPCVGPLLQGLMDYSLPYIFPIIKGSKILPASQTIRYLGWESYGRMTFTFFAFKVEDYANVVSEYHAFIRDYQQRTGWRCNLTSMCYHVNKDDSSFMSYSHDSDVLTLDPATTLPDEGWEDFIGEFNEFCLKRGGRPMVNQSPLLTGEQYSSVYADSLKKFEAQRQKMDPGNRFVSSFMKEKFNI